MIRRVLFVLVCLIFSSASTAHAYSSLGKPASFVTDYTSTLSPNQKQALESKLSQFEQSSSNEISVVIIPSLQGDTIENFSVELFKEWGVGKKGIDNGVLVLISLQDHQMRIEVGYGLEGILTDAQSAKIIDGIMKPAFQDSHYYQGIDTATDSIISLLNGNTPANTSQPKEGFQYTGAWILLFFIPFLFLFFIGTSLANNKTLWPLAVLIGGAMYALLFYLSKTNSIKAVDLDRMITLFIAFFLFSLMTILARNKSWWEGGVLGILIGISIAYYFNTWERIGWYIGLLGLLGLLLDFLASRAKKSKGGLWGKNSSSSHGGFRGFGGGNSGGGGASGRW